jgi:hypothetical protein
MSTEPTSGQIGILRSFSFSRSGSLFFCDSSQFYTLEIAESRYNKGSTILAGQIAHSQWYELFPDPTIADAIMDRIIHNSYILELDSKISMREIMAAKIT